MDNNYDLFIEPKTINSVNGRFRRGHIPFNKGIPMVEWMDGRKIKKIKKFLELGRKKGNEKLAGHNRIPIVGIKDGKLYPFDSITNAGKILRAKGIKVCKRNINSVVNCKKEKNNRNGKFYIRKHAGGFQWFFADEPEKYKMFLI